MLQASPRQRRQRPGPAPPRARASASAPGQRHREPGPAPAPEALHWCAGVRAHRRARGTTPVPACGHAAAPEALHPCLRAGTPPRPRHSIGARVMARAPRRWLVAPASQTRPHPASAALLRNPRTRLPPIATLRYSRPTNLRSFHDLVTFRASCALETDLRPRSHSVNPDDCAHRATGAVRPMIIWDANGRTSGAASSRYAPPAGLLRCLVSSLHRSDGGVASSGLQDEGEGRCSARRIFWDSAARHPTSRPRRLCALLCR